MTAGRATARQQMVSGFVAAGYTPASAAISVDLIMHAVDEAMDTLERVLSPLQGGAHVNAEQAALQLVAALAQKRHAKLMGKLRAAGMGETAVIRVDTRQ